MDNSQKFSNSFSNLMAFFETKAIIESLKKQLIPIGVVAAFATKKIPDGWLLCDGNEYRIEMYQELYDAIGTTFNDENTSNGFFCVPDLQGMFIRGWDMEGNTDSERELGSLQNDAFQGHSHNVIINNNLKTNNAGRHFHYIGYSEYDVRDSNGLNDRSVEVVRDHGYEYKKGNKNTDHDGSHEHEIIVNSDFINIQTPMTSKFGVVRVETETRPKNIALLYCIKAK